MRAFTIIIYIFAAIALTTGASDLLQGVVTQNGGGVDLAEISVANPVLDNVFRFFSGLWFGTGILFILMVRDLDRYKPIMMALLGIVVLGGIGRIISIAQYGLPAEMSGLILVFAGLLAEVIVTPVLLWWLIARHRSSG